MKHFLLVLFSFLFLTSCGIFRKDTGKAAEQSKTEIRTSDEFNADLISKTISLSETQDIIERLASDEFAGRHSTSETYLRSVSYVEKTFQKNGIQPFFSGDYRDTFMINDNPSCNVVGLIGDQEAEDYILIGAHLDHLGIKSGTVDSIYNGANDNASGVTAVLQISKVLAKYKFDKSIIVVLFGGEENGLLGSRALSLKLKEQGVNISAVYNFEMLGKTLTTGSNQVYITGFKRSDLAEKMNAVAQRDFVVFLPAEVRYQLFSRSDNFPFYSEYHIPSHTISTFDFRNYEYYHKAEDEVDQLDIDNMHQIIETAAYVLGTMLMQGIQPTLIEN